MDCEIVCDSRNRDAWLKARRLGIGSSDAAAILGVSPFRSALAVYTDKIGLTEDDEQTEAMKWGNLLEPLILDEFAKETGRDVWKAGQLLRSLEHPWMLSTLDGEQASIAEHDGVGFLEAKATGWRVGDWTEGVPEHVFVQAQHQCATTGHRWGSVVVLVNGCRLLWQDVERNNHFIESVLIPAEAEFWRRVEARDPVAPDGSASAAEAIRALYPSNTKDIITLPGEFLALDDERSALSAQQKETEARIEWINQQIKAAIGEAEMGLLGNGTKYTYRLQKRSEYVVESTEFRVLRRSAPQEK